MFPVALMSPNSTCLSEDASCVSCFGSLNPPVVSNVTPVDQQQPQQKIKKKRNLPGNPDPDAEVIALSPKTLLATNRFVCEICNKGFQRDQNLQLHRRGHNLPWKLKQRNSKDVIKKKAYVCPEASCVHHHPSRALGDLTGIKKHFCRKHGEKKWKCEKCSKIYAVQSDWKAHSKTCGTREYRCDCGTLFSRKDSFVTHRAFCEALAEESARLSAANVPILMTSSATTTTPPANSAQPFNLQQHPFSLLSPLNLSTHQEDPQHFRNPWDPPTQNPNPIHNNNIKPETITAPLSFYQENPPTPQASYKNFMMPSPFHTLHVSASPASSAHLSATALLQKAATVGPQSTGHVTSTMSGLGNVGAGFSPEYLGNFATWQQKSDRGLTRDFLGLNGGVGGGGGGGAEDRGNGNIDVNVNVNVNLRDLLSFTGGVEFPAYDRDRTLLRRFGTEPAGSETWRNC